MFDPCFPLAAVTPADYNPRALSPEARAALRRSLTTLGALKPLIVTDSGRLIAGHQRTGVMRDDLAWSTAPAHILDDVTPGDEIRFNQLHNAADVDLAVTTLSLDVRCPPGWHQLHPGAIIGEYQGTHANELTEICRLLAQHGPWGAAIALRQGQIVVGGLYAHACRTLRLPCLVRVVPTKWLPRLVTAFGRDYGHFSYSHLQRTTWAQGLAQKPRLRGRERNHQGSRSTAYENLLIPRIAAGGSHAGARILDFGAGQFDYVASLRAAGIDIDGYEPYRRRSHKPGDLAIDTEQVHRDIDRLVSQLRDRGRYDVVICDSVLNSVDSAAAEHNVLASLVALCRPGGHVIVSGRTRKELGGRSHARADASIRRVHFPDADGLTGMYRHGVWTYQKFHSHEQVRGIALAYFGTEFDLLDGSGRPLYGDTASNAWAIVAPSTRRPDPRVLAAAITAEFDLPLPGGGSYDRAAEVLDALALPSGERGDYYGTANTGELVLPGQRVAVGYEGDVITASQSIDLSLPRRVIGLDVERWRPIFRAE